MLNTGKSQGSQDDNQEEFSPGDWPTHDDKYPYIVEFSEFISTLPTSAFENHLLTSRQRQLAESFWAAENWGGSPAACAKHLKETLGAKWYTMTSVEEHMKPKRLYYEYVLVIDHKEQWDKQRKNAKLNKKDPV